MAEFNREEALKRKAEIAFKLHECKKHQNGKEMNNILTFKRPKEIMLLLLNKEPTHREACNHLKIENGCLFKIIQKLKKEGMIKSSDDKPMKYLLTEKGRKIAELLRGINNSQETKYIKNQNV